jgi:predicted DNA-binding protein with PD1-like motif/RimJ/RimL family protein N-acetyltransferase
MQHLPLRLTPGLDLRRALEAAVQDQPSRSAFVVAGIGSLSQARLRFAGETAECEIPGPLEVVSLSGTLSASGAHLHMLVSDAAGRVHGGHVGYGNTIRTTAEILLALLPGWSLTREFDPATGFNELVVLRRKAIVLRQLSLQEARSLTAPGGALTWTGVVHAGAVPPPFVVQRALDRVSAGGPEAWWLPFLIVDADAHAVVGGCAFKGPPKDGRVEVLYGVSPHCGGRGIASAAVAELVALAFRGGALEVLAEIEPRNAGSRRVVEKCGFQRLGERTAEDGVRVEQWRRVRD